MARAFPILILAALNGIRSAIAGCSPGRIEDSLHQLSDSIEALSPSGEPCGGAGVSTDTRWRTTIRKVATLPLPDWSRNSGAPAPEWC